MEGAEDNEEDNTLMAGLDIAADTVMDALSEIEGSVEDEVLSYLSVDEDNSTLTSDNSMNISGSSKVASVATRRSTRINTPKTTTTKAPRVGGSKNGIAWTGGLLLIRYKVLKPSRHIVQQNLNFCRK